MTSRTRTSTRPRKKASTRKDLIIPVRCSKEQKMALMTAAKRKGIGVSTMLLMLGLSEVGRRRPRSN